MYGGGWKARYGFYPTAPLPTHAGREIENVESIVSSTLLLVFDPLDPNQYVKIIKSITLKSKKIKESVRYYNQMRNVLLNQYKQHFEVLKNMNIILCSMLHRYSGFTCTKLFSSLKLILTNIE